MILTILLLFVYKDSDDLGVAVPLIEYPPGTTANIRCANSSLFEVISKLKNDEFMERFQTNFATPFYCILGSDLHFRHTFKSL